MKSSAFCIALFLISFGVPVLSADDRSPSLSVYHINPWTDGTVLGLASAGAVVPLFFESTLVHPHPPGNSQDVNFFDRIAVGNHNQPVAYLSHVQVALAIAVPVYLDSKDLGFHKPLAEDFVVYAEVLSLNSAISNAARYSVQRPRPDLYQPGADVNDPGEYLSFYSGHVASACAALSAASMTYGYRYGFHWWPWAVTFVAGASEGVERTVAGRHYPTDDLVGALIGTSLGITVPMLHHRKSEDRLTIVPEDHGAQLVWNRRF